MLRWFSRRRKAGDAILRMLAPYAKRVEFEFNGLPEGFWIHPFVVGFFNQFIHEIRNRADFLRLDDRAFLEVAQYAMGQLSHTDGRELCTLFVFNAQQRDVQHIKGVTNAMKMARFMFDSYIDQSDPEIQRAIAAFQSVENQHLVRLSNELVERADQRVAFMAQLQDILYVEPLEREFRGQQA